MHTAFIGQKRFSLEGARGRDSRAATTPGGQLTRHGDHGPDPRQTRGRLTVLNRIHWASRWRKSSPSSRDTKTRDYRRHAVT